MVKMVVGITRDGYDGSGSFVFCIMAMKIVMLSGAGCEGRGVTMVGSSR